MKPSSWVRGDMSALEIPADAHALQERGVDFLTRAFLASGAIDADNGISRITRFEAFSGGGTGSKLLLDVAYHRPSPALHNRLFVKFSRNFDDPIRDSVRHMLKPEIEFAALSSDPGFPITVPQCYFADFHSESGTGLQITQRIPFGEEGYEPHYLKCMDHLLPAPLEHYQAIVRALGRLAGNHKAGHLSQAFYREFPFDGAAAAVEDPLRYRGEKLQRRLSRLGEFAARYPQLLPPNVRQPNFLSRFAVEAEQFVAVEADVRGYLLQRRELIALCHWNANIDNAWFWRDATGQLACGLMDWGAVAQMSVAKSLYGAFSGADTALWDNHLEDILETFVVEFHRSGGPVVSPDELKIHVLLYTALMGVAYLLDAPAIIEHKVADLSNVTGPGDPAFAEIEDARVQLHMLTMFLNQWQTRDIGRMVAELGFKPAPVSPQPQETHCDHLH